ATPDNYPDHIDVVPHAVRKITRLQCAHAAGRRVLFLLDYRLKQYGRVGAAGRNVMVAAGVGGLQTKGGNSDARMPRLRQLHPQASSHLDFGLSDAIGDDPRAELARNPTIRCDSHLPGANPFRENGWQRRLPGLGDQPTSAPTESDEQDR